MPKENCKYWEKCYQKNEYHLQKYNHPKDHAVGNQQKKLSPPREEEVIESTNDPPKCEIKKVIEPSCSNITSSEEKESECSIPQKRRLSKENEEEPKSGTESEPKCIEYDTKEIREEVFRNLSGKNYLAMLEKRIKLSVESEYKELVSSNDFIRHKFLVEMPNDFFAFWKFVCELSKQPEGGKPALMYFEKQFNLKLVGPFEFLAGLFHKAKIREPGDYLRHWRFFYDPPEFQTVFVRRGTAIHYGYWRDTPDEKTALLIARNSSNKNCEFEFVAGNIFEAFQYYLTHDHPVTPFNTAAVANAKKAAKAYLTNNELEYDGVEKLKKARAPKVLAPTLHRAGIVAPFESKSEVGYRPLITSDAELKKVFSLYEGERTNDAQEVIMSKLQPIATACTLAMDECDFATALEFGIDLFCSGRLEVHALAQSMLVPAYSLLSRPQFIAISKAHMEQRSKSIHLSMFDLDD